MRAISRRTLAVHMPAQYTLDVESASFEAARKGGKTRHDINPTSVVVEPRVPDIHLTCVIGVRSEQKLNNHAILDSCRYSDVRGFQAHRSDERVMGEE